MAHSISVLKGWPGFRLWKLMTIGHLGISVLYLWRKSRRNWQIFWLSIKLYWQRTRAKRKLAQRTSKDIESSMVNLISIGCILWVEIQRNFKRKRFGILLFDRDFQVRQLPRTCLIVTVVTFIVIVGIEFFWYQSLLFMLHCHPGKSENLEMTLYVSFNCAHLVNCRFTSCTF